MDFLQHNWLVLLSLIVALIGGVPGVISALKHFKDKPKFHFSLVGIITGEIAEDGTEKRDSMLLISGTVSNDGPQPLSPDHFELSVDIEGQWRSFKPWLIPEGAQFSSQEQQIDINEPWKRDLQRFSGPIPKGSPLHGFLMFVHKEIPIEQIRKSLNEHRSVKITCVDIYGRKHQKEFQANAHRIGEPTIYPKHGMSVKQKT